MYPFIFQVFLSNSILKEKDSVATSNTVECYNAALKRRRKKKKKHQMARIWNIGERKEQGQDVVGKSKGAGID